MYLSVRHHDINVGFLRQINSKNMGGRNIGGSAPGLIREPLPGSARTGPDLL